MIAAIIHEHAAYGHWATKRFVERLSREPDAVLDAPVPSSFPSLRKTLLHMRDAECAWTSRLLGEPVRWPAEASTGLDSVMRHADRFAELARGYDQAGLLAVRAYTDLKGNAHASPAWRMIMHCVNHGTQHRGQLITMMRALGLDGIPQNDLVVYQRTLLG